MTVLTDQETLSNGVAVGGGEEFRRDKEFRRLNPPLSAAELAELEALLVADGGATDAFVVWQEEQFLLDGYNRATICERLGCLSRPAFVSLPDWETGQGTDSPASERTAQPDAGRLTLSAQQAFPGREGSARRDRCQKEGKYETFIVDPHRLERDCHSRHSG
jgi:hypothetical protein